METKRNVTINHFKMKNYAKKYGDALDGHMEAKEEMELFVDDMLELLLTDIQRI